MISTKTTTSALRLEQLRSRYARNLPERLGELRAAMSDAGHSPPDSSAVADAVVLAHRLAGTAGTYGFPGTSALGTDCERVLQDYQARGVPLPDWESLIAKFPNALDAPDPKALQRLEVDPLDSAARGKGRVLVIDDDDDFLAVIADILEQSRYTPIVAKDTQALDELIGSAEPDLILLDVEMPRLSGFEVCRAIRDHECWQDIPIVFLTVRSAPEDRIAAFQAGGDDFITKPIVAEELLARVGVRIERGRMARERQTLLMQAKCHRNSLLGLLDQLGIGTLLLSSNGRVGFVNRYCGTLGLDPGTGVDQHWQELLPLDKEGRRRFQEQLELQADRRVKLLLTWKKGKRQFFVECELRDAPDAAQQQIVCLTDVSEMHRLRQELQESRYGRLIGNSAPMRELLRLVGKVARGDWTVLIEGETGTGKELVAHAIHAASRRKDGPFVTVNSAGLSETLLSSQLFGHRKGAFTGAVADQEGYFEAAHGGTLFLDEIGDLPQSMQASLLRAVQEKEVTRLGETRTRKVDVRILTATHKDLTVEEAEGRFRRDLLYRLRVARVYLPPLRERTTDIPLLVESFLGESYQISGTPRPRVSPEATQCLLSYDWPGNVRELKATIDYAVIRCSGERIAPADLPPEIGQAAHAAAIQPEPLPAGGDDRTRILAALERTGGNRLKAAELLGISRATFYRRLAKLGISTEP